MQHDERDVGPSVRVVGTNFGNGRTVSANGTLQIAFDRVLSPASVNRQAAVVIDVGGRAIGNPVVTYDPVTRVMSLSGPDRAGSRWLTPGMPYEVLLTDPNEPNSIGGVRALDGATIDHTRPRRLAFFAGDESTDARERGFEPDIEFCRDVLPVFRAKCSGSSCHSAPTTTRPTMGLVLDTSAGVLNTAVRRAAQEANTGSRAGLGSEPGRVFGVDLPIVDPGNPGASWLMYKVLMAAPPDETADASASVLKETHCESGAPGPAPVVLSAPLASYAPLTAEERARFSDSMSGSPMPYPSGSANLTFQELERLRAWIAQGAKVSECAVCLP